LIAFVILFNDTCITSIYCSIIVQHRNILRIIVHLIWHS